MPGKTVGFLYAAIGMCQVKPGYRVAWCFGSHESRNNAIELIRSVVAELAPEAGIFFRYGEIAFPNGSVIMLRVPAGAVGDEVNNVEIENSDEYGEVVFSDWMYNYLKTRTRL